MPGKLYTLLLLASVGAFAGCKKDSPQQRCKDLTNAIAVNDLETVKTIITKYIDQLSSKTHTEENLQKLVQSLSGKCSITAKTLCYNCIYTFPGQSEIRISFISGGTTIEKTIDISSISTTNENMKFVSMHE